MKATKFYDMCNTEKEILNNFIDDDAPELDEEIDEETEKLLELLAVEIIEIDDLQIYESESENDKI